MKKQLCILIPAHNEQTVIAQTLRSFEGIVPMEDIYVVSDGSVDYTARIAQVYTPNVLSITPGLGKAGAMNTAIAHFKIPQKYTYILPMDADTKVTKAFVREALAFMEKDTKEEYICLVGKVTGQTYNWLTSYRLWEYEIAQTIHKAAQAKENAIIVCPGCSTMYRTKLFKKVEIPSGTLTEDMDLTFLIHRMRLGKIGYTNQSAVITQDPRTLKDYIKQLDRWYVGFWQCLIKHQVPWGGQMLDIEVGLLALEGLFNGLLMTILLFLLPLTIMQNPGILVTPLLVDFFLFFIPTMTYTVIKHRSLKLFLYTPQFYFMRFICSIIFIICFIKALMAIDLRMQWAKVTRYASLEVAR